MLKRLAVMLLVLCGVSAAHAQRPTVLELAPDLRQNLKTLAAGLHNEVLLCLHGEIRGDTAHLDRMEMHPHELSTTTRSAAEACDDSALGWWHNHSLYRWRANEHGRHLKLLDAPRISCRLSATDVATGLEAGIPFVLISTDGDHWCWWAFDQLRLSPLPLAPPPGQTSWKGKR